MNEKDSSQILANEAVADAEPAKRKPGRPRSSPYDLATQKRLNNQRFRQTKREGNQIAVEVYLPKAWHDRLLREGASLREVAVEAFALWFEKKGLPTDTGDGLTPKEEA